MIEAACSGKRSARTLVSAEARTPSAEDRSHSPEAAGAMETLYRAIVPEGYVERR